MSSEANLFIEPNLPGDNGRLAGEMNPGTALSVPFQSSMAVNESNEISAVSLMLAENARKIVAKYKFALLVREWNASKNHSSSIEKLAMEPSYQKIIGLGPDAIPLILRELETKPGHWSWALRAITGENPVKPEHRGNLKKMAEDWLEWARKHGYQW